MESYQFFVKKVHYLPQIYASQYFSIEFLQHCRHESFDGDFFASQSSFYADVVQHTTGLIVNAQKYAAQKLEQEGGTRLFSDWG